VADPGAVIGVAVVPDAELAVPMQVLDEAGCNLLGVVFVPAGTLSFAVGCFGPKLNDFLTPPWVPRESAEDASKSVVVMRGIMVVEREEVVNPWVSQRRGYKGRTIGGSSIGG